MVIYDGGDASGTGDGVPQQVPGYMGCEWPIDTACDTTFDDLDPDVQARATALAVNTIRRLTGYRVGGCPITVRPCAVRACYSLDGWGPWSVNGGQFFPLNTGGNWTNNGCSCTDSCSCFALSQVRLPGPVGEVYEVKINGDVVTDYIRYGRNLIATGDTVWPTCQDLTLPDTEENTFSVQYLNAYPVDGLGAYAAGVLAVEYAKLCRGQACALPRGVVSVSRPGVTMEIEAGAFPNGLTGIDQVDAYIALWNPGALTQDSMVWTPNQKKVWQS